MRISSYELQQTDTSQTNQRISDFSTIISRWFYVFLCLFSIEYFVAHQIEWKT